MTDKKVTDGILHTGVISAPDRLTGTTTENKLIFDRLVRAVVAQSLNPLIDELTGPEGLDSIGTQWGISLGEMMNQVAAHLEDLFNPHHVTVEQIGAETPEGAQAKADEALAAANRAASGALGAHLEDLQNPHRVTVLQIGAETPEAAQSKVDAHATRKDNPHQITVAQIGAETPAGAQSKVDAHANLQNNPHQVTPEQIGAETPGGAQSKVDAHAAMDNNPHRVTVAQIGAETPQGAWEKAGEAVAAHAALNDNPHRVTPEQIGAETPGGAQSKVDAHAAMNNNPHRVTPAQIGAETPAGAQSKVDAHASQKNNPHQVTPAQIGAETPGGAQSKVNAHAAMDNNPHRVTVSQIGAETPAGAQSKANAAVTAHAADPEAHKESIYENVKQITNTLSFRTYMGTLLLTVPAAGWTLAEENPDYRYFCDVAAKVSEDTMPNGSYVPGCGAAAKRAGVLDSCQTFDGSVRFFSRRIPSGDVDVWISLYKAWDGNTQVDGVPVGEGLELTGEGRLAIRTGEGLKLDDSGTLVLDQDAVFSEDDISDISEEDFAAIFGDEE